MKIKLNLKGADGSDVPNEIVNTINAVAPESAPGKTYISAVK